jgi:excinuclease ABC subunit C
VIFDRLAMQTSEYRRFNVRPPEGGDDYAAMREALTRRCARIVSGEYPTPDLLVVDGGKGQVAVAAEVLAEQGLHTTRLDRDREGAVAQARRRGHRLSRSRPSR